MTARTQEHTPGPWAVGSYCMTAHVIYADNGEGEQIAAASRSAFPDSESDANARLIAAAPDLLAVLKQVRDFWAGGDAPDDLTNAIHAAIARARGSK
jgi:hypothetical protein